jgi:hypothetical protein
MEILLKNENDERGQADKKYGLPNTEPGVPVVKARERKR